jgi:uncharacterized membrane protein
MDLITLVITLIVIGILLLNIVVVVAVVLWLLGVFLGYRRLPHIHVGR